MMVHELKETYRKNRHDLKGFLLGGYPRFVWSGGIKEIRGEVPVFVFHSVEADRFDDQLRFLKENGYHTLENADALHACLTGERTIDPNSVLLTFDDGLESLYRVAFPLLKQYGFNAVSFIVPSFVGRPGFCGWDQIREMHESGVIDFQSHTLFHRYTPDWPRVMECLYPIHGMEAEMERYPTMEEDYRRSKEIIEERLGKTVRHLCYPDYDGTDASILSSMAAGYVSNFWGVIPGRRTNKWGDDPFRIVRILEQYLFRMPGKGRRSLSGILGEMWSRHSGAFAGRLFGRGRNGGR